MLRLAPGGRRATRSVHVASAGLRRSNRWCRRTPGSGDGAGTSSVAARHRRRHRQRTPIGELAFEDGERLIDAELLEIDLARGKTISVNRDAGRAASTVSTVGMRFGSRGLFDWTWKPSGRVTCSAAWTVAPGGDAVALDDRRDVALTRGPALRDRGKSDTTESRTTRGHRRAAPQISDLRLRLRRLRSCDRSLHFFERDRPGRQRQRRRDRPSLSPAADPET